jgi:hypothetical protein
MRPLVSALLLGLVVLGSIRAQDVHVVHADENGVEAVRLEAFVSGGSERGVGLGWIRFELENLSERAYAISVELSSRRFSRNDVATRKGVTLEAHGRSSFFLPVTVPPDSGRVVVEVDGSQYEAGINFARGRGHVGLFVSDQSGTGSFGLAVLEAMPSDTANPKPYVTGSDALPADWRFFTSFSAVVVDGRARLGAEVQDALRRYAYVGGRVVVATPSLLPAGPLRDAVGDRAGVRDHGMGQLAAIGALGGDTTRMRQVLAEMRRLGDGVWPAPYDLFAEQDIAGLGKAPVTAFLLVILLFAILVGPVNFWGLKKRTQPLLALVTVPVLGFGTTFVILTYGIFHDGFGVRGVTRSWTLLDQVEHEGATISARTLFAGLAPSDLTTEQQSMVLSGRAGLSRRDGPDRWHWDGDRGVLGGGVLPSRTITPLLSAQQGPVRERLTVRRSGDALEVLADGGLKPVGNMVLRDLDGDYWAGTDGRLTRTDAVDGAAKFLGMLRESRQIRVDAGDRTTRLELPAVLPRWGARGTYATKVQAAPWIDEHGMTIEYDGQQHWVFGRMHSQDFVQ